MSADVLVNNAGGAHGVDRVEDGKDSDWETMFQTNALGILRVTRAVLPFMKPYSGGIILNLGSIAGRVAYEGGSAYCASKAAELSITKALRLASSRKSILMLSKAVLPTGHLFTPPITS